MAGRSASARAPDYRVIGFGRQVPGIGGLEQLEKDL
jgi:hypothetical protein